MASVCISPGTTLTSRGCRPSATRTWVPTWQSSPVCTPTSSTACQPYMRSTPTSWSTRTRWDTGPVRTTAVHYRAANEPNNWHNKLTFLLKWGTQLGSRTWLCSCCIRWPLAPFSRSCQHWSGTSRRGDRDWGASWSRSSTQWPWTAEDHPEPSSPPSLHSSSPSVSPPRSSHPDNEQNSNPPNNTPDELQMDWSSILQNEGVTAEMGGPVCAYMCMCVFRL